MKNRLLYNRLINNISRSIYRSINENYFKLSNITDKKLIIKKDFANEYYNEKILNETLTNNELLKLVLSGYTADTNEILKKLVGISIKYLGQDCDLNWINTEKITNMGGLFLNSDFSAFNGNISNWDVSNVTNMNAMFAFTDFNGDLSNWNTHKLLSTFNMFLKSKFNNNSLNNWDTSNITNANFMFKDTEFNLDISNWDVSNVQELNMIFDKTCFYQDLSSWIIDGSKYKYVIPSGFDLMFTHNHMVNKYKLYPSAFNIDTMRGPATNRYSIDDNDLKLLKKYSYKWKLKNGCKNKYEY